MKRYILFVCFLLVRAPSPVELSCDQPKLQEIVSKLFPHRPTSGIWIREADAGEMMDHVPAAVYWNKRLRIEMFSLSNNSHTLLKADEQSDRELQHRAIASAVVEALMDLRTMEHANRVVTSATFKIAQRNLRTTTCDDRGSINLIDVEELFHDFLVTINETMRTSEPLFEEMYASALASLPSQMPAADDYDDDDDDSSKDDPPQESISFSKDDDKIANLEQPTLRPAFVNKVFMREALNYRSGCGNEDEDDFSFGWMASAMMELAKGSDDRKLQQRLNVVYRTTVNVIANVLPWSSAEGADEESVRIHMFLLLYKTLDMESELGQVVKQSMRQLNAQRMYMKSVHMDTPL